MAALVVGTDQVVEYKVTGAVGPIVQNLGPGILYIGVSSHVTTATGLQIPVHAAYELPRAFDHSQERSIFLIATAAGTDVRVLAVP